MKKNLVIGVLLAVLVLSNMYHYSQDSLYRQVSDMNQIADVIKSENPNQLLIDLRDKEDYIYGHVDKFINIPFDDNGEVLLNFLEKSNYRNKEIVLMCYSGNRSSKAFELLAVNGYGNLTDITIGYDRYVGELGDEFIPEKGSCNCTN